MAKQTTTKRVSPSKKGPSAAVEKCTSADYAGIHGSIVALLEQARHAAARSVNTLMTASYWEIGRRIVEFDQGGKERADYGKALLQRLSVDLTTRFGRGFGVDNLEQMRLFYLTYPPSRISETLSRKFGVEPPPSTGKQRGKKSESAIRIFDPGQLAQAFPLTWTHYIHLMRRTRSTEEREFYEAEALRGGWSVRQLARQIGTQFYTRALLSKNKRAMLEKDSQPKPSDVLTPDEAVRDPYVLEFLDLKDEYSEFELEDALIHRLEDFLLELGNDFAFVGRQRRLRLDESWFRVDLLFFHRRLRCLVIIDLKLDELTHADVGQMHLYCNYAREHWTMPGENPPVGLILCVRAKSALARYALDGLPNKVMAAEYRTVLPDVKLLQAELEKTRHALEARRKRLPTRQRKLTSFA
ncbi:MAG: PDDEXK nuclease domain-containing protein [Proteobacteria bacterium]|nr:PDDEXK nuclease domain-containing protein [Cystobacterineae bacterium]MCL2258682.1 PDDEXK nuclease domain-containing protein [Cystobacterineae bacterium]MCL2314934.1 PDDEXK nuclease domain-containing protein [Pseudomonadota bacterium]MCL2626179.1 PDDEXK nuclease domain-containing protein [Cystobacterineae bacterium]